MKKLSVTIITCCLVLIVSAMGFVSVFADTTTSDESTSGETTATTTTTTTAPHTRTTKPITAKSTKVTTKTTKVVKPTYTVEDTSESVTEPSTEEPAGTTASDSKETSEGETTKKTKHTGVSVYYNDTTYSSPDSPDEIQEFTYTTEEMMVYSNGEYPLTSEYNTLNADIFGYTYYTEESYTGEKAEGEESNEKEDKKIVVFGKEYNLSQILEKDKKIIISLAVAMVVLIALAVVTVMLIRRKKFESELHFRFKH